jgi:LuxR family transcriptional regulator, maltose regulon positive regulatory protein
MGQERSETERPLSPTLSSIESAPLGESPLLHTKFNIPRTTTTLLARPRLSNRLSQQPNGYLTLLSAPAGFGKTTLVVDWLRQQECPAAWLALDEQDNDPVLFWRYLITAVQQADGRLGQRAQAALAITGRASLETAVTLLLNDIVSHLPADDPFTLVLDDLHWIHTAAIHQSLNYLLQHQPPQLHLILLTRADPPLSLARLRVEGRLVELRAADLRLTPAEIAAYLNQVMALDISDEGLHLLAERTEGWAAGLQLAALSLRQSDANEAARLMQTFAGARQHVFAYLVEEVLLQQPEQVRHFLQQTAVLRQFSAPLCAAVTGQSDITRLLAHLTAENLFITPLDEQGEWFRYHPLFAEMLRTRLDTVTLRECHRRAARWYTEQQLMADAMHHTLAAKDYALMASLLTQTYKTTLGHGLLVSLQKWLAALPEVYRTPRLQVAAAWTRVYEIGEGDLHQMFAAVRQQLTEPDDALQGEMLAIEAIYASLYGRPEQSVQLATRAFDLIAPDDFLSRAAAYQALGNAYRYLGELDAAIAAYSQARQQFEALSAPFMTHLPLYRLASVQIMQGRLHQAWQTYEMVRQRAQAAGYEPSILTGEVYGYLSDLYCEWNDLEEAVACARQEIELAKSGHILLALVDGYLKLSAALAAQNDRLAAADALQQAGETAVQLQSVPVSALVELHVARHELAWGNLVAAETWAETYGADRKTPRCPLNPVNAQTADLLLARVWLAQGQSEAALDLLQAALREFEAAGRIRLVVETNVLQALTYARQREISVSQKLFIRALALAKPEGYVRVFVENGPCLIGLLSQTRHLFPTYVAQLLSAIGERVPATPTVSDHLLDPLTERERDILALLAQGRPNRQIADALFISVGTVKGHVNHILSKLDVQNRTQAFLRARELGLLD